MLAKSAEEPQLSTLPVPLKNPERVDCVLSSLQILSLINNDGRDIDIRRKIFF